MSDNFKPAGLQSDSKNPYSSPASDLSEQRDPGDLPLAGRWRRLGATILDGLIMSAITLPPVILFIGGWAAYLEKANEQPFMTGLIGGAFGLVMYLLVNGYFLAKDGQSLGKKMLGTKIVRSDGSQADFMRIVTHRLLPVYVCNLIPVVGGLLAIIDVLFIFRESKQCIHDNIADTVVIRI